MVLQHRGVLYALALAAVVAVTGCASPTEPDDDGGETTTLPSTAPSTSTTVAPTTSTTSPSTSTSTSSTSSATTTTPGTTTSSPTTSTIVPTTTTVTTTTVSTTTVATTTTTTTAPAPGFQTLLFNPGYMAACAGCHSMGGNPPTLTASRSFATARCTPGNINASAIYQKPAQAGVSHGGGKPWGSSPQLQAVINWINGGCLP